MRKTRTKTGQGSRPSLIRRILNISLIAGVWAFFALLALGFWWSADLPDVRHVVTPARRPPVSILAADGSVIQRIGGREGKIVDVRELPSHLVHAVMAIEDRRFHEHWGIDPRGLLRAVFANLRAGDVVQGGSTITQQLAKNLFLSPERSLRRKVQEALLALRLEHAYNKDQILAAYLNEVYFGSGAYGVDAAAHTYFGKSARDIGLLESAVLAGLLKAPSNYAPTENPYRAAARTRVVLSAMVDAGYIRQADVDALNLQPPPPRRKPLVGDSFRYFSDWVLGQVSSLGMPEGEGLVIHTTLDPDIQRTAEREIDGMLAADGPARAISQAAAVVMGLDGGVLAMVGGANYQASAFNRITQAQRQPGSAFKPVLFLSALEGGLSPQSLVEDAPLSIEGWSPQNFDKSYMGPVTLEDALAHSLNTAAVRVMAQVGIPAVHATARRLGLTTPLADDLSLALGSSVVRPLELAAAYAVVANGGFAVWPHAVVRVENLSGKVLYEREEPAPVPVVDPALAQTLSGMMRRVVDAGTGAAAQMADRRVAGKTGTSQDFRDAWFCGFDAERVALVWLGNDDNAPMKGVAGGGLPARMFHGIMSGMPAPAVPSVQEAPVPGFAGIEESVPSSTAPGDATDAEGDDSFVGRILWFLRGPHENAP